MVNMNSITEEMKKELAFTEKERKELEQARKLCGFLDTVLKRLAKQMGAM